MTEKLLREFSKEDNQEERDKLAQDIKNERKERHESLGLLEEQKESTDSQIESGENKIEKLSDEIELLNTKFYKKIVFAVQIYNKEKDIEKKRKDLGLLEKSTKEIGREMDELSIRDGVPPEEFRESRRKIEEFYEQERDRWKETPQSKEDIEKYFSIDNLKQLSLKDYTLLLQRFNSDMITHVTRQGIRDHGDMMPWEHSEGMDTFQNGFVEMLQSGHIKYNLELRVLDKEKREAMIDYFDLENNTYEKAKANLENFLREGDQNSAGSFVDRHGPHFAMKKVADRYYGSESDNEIFIAYPAYAIEANFYHRNDPHTVPNGDNYNDLWVYMQDHENIPLDAGIVFIREDAEVNPETGSVYELNPDSEPIYDLELKNRINETLDKDGMYDFIILAIEKLGKLRYKIDDRFAPEEEREIVQGLIDEVKEKFDGDLDIAKTILNYHFLTTIKTYDGAPQLKEEMGDEIDSRLEDLALKFIKSKDTISSKEYWEKYFDENPDQRPNKIVYYKDSDPTKGLNRWKFNNGLSINKKEPLDINERRIMEKTSEINLPKEINKEIERFRSIAEDVIEDYYGDKRKRVK